MTFDEYRDVVLSTSGFPDQLCYLPTALCEEAGEAAGKFKKLARDHGVAIMAEVPEEAKEPILKELGDVLWYITAIANELGTDIADVANRNVEKVLGRVERGTLGGSGDDR